MPDVSIFTEKKRKILQELNRPDEEYKDLSPIGAVDPNIRQLVDQINETDDYVTTSSCAGRISVFLEGVAKPRSNDQEDEDTTISSSNQGKGGGKWLFVTHDPVDLSPLQEDGELLRLFQMPDNGMKISFPPPSTEERKVRFVHFKFEPMVSVIAHLPFSSYHSLILSFSQILHLLTSSLTSAQHCLSSALSAGFRESGIVGITGSDPTPHVGIRTQGLALESLIAWQDPDTGEIQPMVSEGYLRTLVDLANQRFVANEERKARFTKHLLQRKEEAQKQGDFGDWEPKDVRRERKKQEGLKRKEEIERQRKEREMEAKELEGDGSDELLVEGSGVPTSMAKGDPLPAERPKMLAERGHGPVVHQKNADA